MSGDYELHVRSWSWWRRLRLRLGLIPLPDFRKDRGGIPFDANKRSTDGQ